MKKIIWIFGESATGKKTFIDLTYESLFDMIEVYFTSEKEKEWLKYLRKRYIIDIK